MALTLTDGLCKISEWASNNCMALNADKTKSMLIFSKPRKLNMLANNNDMLQISIQDKEIETVSNTKLLGIHLDSSLTCASKIGARKEGKKKSTKACGLLVVIALNLFQKNIRFNMFFTQGCFRFKR